MVTRARNPGKHRTVSGGAPGRGPVGSAGRRLGWLDSGTPKAAGRERLHIRQEYLTRKFAGSAKVLLQFHCRRTSNGRSGIHPFHSLEELS